MEITEIKAKLSLSDVLQQYGLKPNKNQMLYCPFHEDKTPSMQVYPKTNTVYCFSSACKSAGKRLDVIDLIELQEDISTHEAILKATALAGALPEPLAKPTTQTPATGVPAVQYEKLFKVFIANLKRASRHRNTCS